MFNELCNYSRNHTLANKCGGFSPLNVQLCPFSGLLRLYGSFLTMVPVLPPPHPAPDRVPRGDMETPQGGRVTPLNILQYKKEPISILIYPYNPHQAIMVSEKGQCQALPRPCLQPVCHLSLQSHYSVTTSRHGDGTVTNMHLTTYIESDTVYMRGIQCLT